MTPAPGLDAYLRDPVGHYFAGPTFLHWRAAPDLLGFVLWGRPDEREIRLLIRCFETELRPASRGHVSLADVRRLESVDLNAFEVMTRFVSEHASRLGETTARQAVVRPSGFLGAVAAGFYAVNPAPYPVRIFEEPREAMSWLEAGSPALLAELESLQATAAGTPPVVLALRSLLATRLADAELPAVARELGLSERTLQRRLSDAGTSFVAEHNQVRLRTAQTLLRDTQMKLAAIAAAVGCSSPQHLALLFRKQTGQSPSAWRAAHGGPTVDDAD